jgi:hypothetical protein
MVARRYKKPIIGIKLRSEVEIPDFVSKNGKVVEWNCKTLQKLFDGSRKKRGD